MSVRPPRRVPDAWGSGNIDALNYEVAQEQAATLGRLGGRLNLALQALARFDADASAGVARADEREALLAAAGEALWYYVVQREVLGLGGSEEVMRELRVPREVRLRMGLPRRDNRTR
jgi:hypothetical protein